MQAPLLGVIAAASITSLVIGGSPRADEPKPVRPGVPAVQTDIANLKPAENFSLGGTPDWMALTDDAVWVANAKRKVVQHIDPQANKIAAVIAMPETPCSGLAAGFGSLWVPLCGTPPSIARVDLASNTIIGTVPIGPADDEGGITASPDSIWIVTDKNGTLSRIDPNSLSVKARIALSPGSYNPFYADGLVWVTGFDSNQVIAVDPTTDTIAAAIPTGPHPRFLTLGAGSIWTLNQGDGSITRVDIKSRRATATINAGIRATEARSPMVQARFGQPCLAFR